MLKKVPGKGRIVAAFCLGVALMAATCSLAQAKSYNINRLDIEALVNPDGSMKVNEARTYYFTGSFSFAYRDLPRGGPVTYGDFTVSEGGEFYRRSDSKEPGTYSIKESANATRVEWYYRAEDESRTFGFGYVARGAVERHYDAAVLYFQFLAEDWAIPHNNVRVTVAPPPGVSRETVNEWIHGPLWARSTIQPDGTVIIVCDYLPANTFLEIRALYPADAFPQIEQSTELVRSQIKAEEARLAEEANRQRQEARENLAAREKRMGYGKWVAGGICLVGLILWTWIYRAFRRAPRVPQVHTVDSEVPGDTPPALLDYLLNSRRVSSGALIGTMLDLARRGFLKLREERVRKKKIFGGTSEESEYHWDLDRSRWSEAGELHDYELELMNFIFRDLTGGADSISLEQLKKKRREFASFFRKWSKLVEVHAKKKEWFDRRSISGFHRSLVVGIAVMVLAIPVGMLFELWAVALIVVGGAILILSFAVPHRTSAGETLARRWKGLQRYLRKYEFRQADRSDLLANISSYLVYGVVLGLSSKIYEELATHLPEGKQTSYVPWYIYAGSGRGGFSPAVFGQAFSSMVATATSSMSTAAGTGGGASVGGGGGASSGGGGAG